MFLQIRRICPMLPTLVATLTEQLGINGITLPKQSCVLIEVNLKAWPVYRYIVHQLIDIL